MIDNLWEEKAEWQQDIEDLNLELIDQHELAAATEVEAANTFKQELQRRNLK